jgi:hypothetical protein
VTGADPTLVHDRSGVRITLELELAGEEIRVEHVERRRDEPGGIDHSTGADHYPRGVDEEDAAVREKLTLDLRDIGADDAVQHRAGRGLLHELRDLAGADRETLPMDDGARRIGDFELVRAEPLDMSGPVHDLGPRRVGPQRRHAKTTADRHGHRPHEPQVFPHGTSPVAVRPCPGPRGGSV